MRILRLMVGVTKLKNMRNDYVRERLEIKEIGKKNRIKKIELGRIIKREYSHVTKNIR